ncbi:MAG: trypsin-like peptidase domain-containing protein [Sphaerochaeta sp.]|jgi:S1-C subfamily serine protease|nr:trypsin-like peptidase domain-containing protein [Sphaerochaeta sp.]MCH3919295.1 trypsin-like peptidase domain-containing protein [Sphaerochaeta sp.]MCI2077068.1 trypsin-like peptidase domain-containing protein [Sphaerochaeta sp.]MCI2097495.1 trypsin-like peptidase domain-containing protein [Sphaerochaeta sp.]MCI2104636.1 trypsin-like peptidase domain-containing protein [Sphaerochaeta sp.]
MLKATKRRIRRLLVEFLVVVAAIVVASLLVRWTRSIARDKQREELKKTLKTVVDTEGEQALFDLADLHVNQILYGDDGLTVLAGDNADWQYSFDEMQNIRVYQDVSPSVVYITTTAAVPSASAYMEVLPSQGTGSGFVISRDGYILTNAHVVEGATNVIVGLSDQKQFNGKLVGLDKEDDLAVIKINVDKNTPLKPVKLGTSEDLKVGQKVIAIGNPFGYERAMTTGVVSGLNRPVKTEAGRIIMNAIQTDASINPGNSGGPLLNGKGEVIGISSSIYSVTGSSQGISFAIPIDTAVSLIPDLIKYGAVRRGWMDIVPVQLTKALADYANLTVTQGVLVSQVQRGGEAEKAGILGGKEQVKYGSSVMYLGGDVITAIGDMQITGLNDFYLALLNTREGDKVKVTINRKGETKVLTVTLRARTGEDVSSLVK